MSFTQNLVIGNADSIETQATNQLTRKSAVRKKHPPFDLICILIVIGIEKMSSISRGVAFHAIENPLRICENNCDANQYLCNECFDC